MYVAAKEGHDYTVQFLVEKGANINIKDKFGVSFAKVWMISWRLVIVVTCTR